MVAPLTYHTSQIEPVGATLLSARNGSTSYHGSVLCLQTALRCQPTCQTVPLANHLKEGNHIFIKNTTYLLLLLSLFLCPFPFSLPFLYTLIPILFSLFQWQYESIIPKHKLREFWWLVARLWWEGGRRGGRRMQTDTIAVPTL